MKAALIDTDILSLFFRNHENVITNFRKYLEIYDSINISILTFYEILSGLKHRDAYRQLETFYEFAKSNSILPLTETSASISSDIYAALRKSGNPLDDIDILIAGIALANDFILVTHNIDHFNRIKNLELVDWSKS
ncbi:MAG: type II toxin-antitoxin system VapC family toxin [Proteobacteria bacterium]|nr:type II toxin-antitoxin system VapC family toxin [Pseudomonadota bacterium]